MCVPLVASLTEEMTAQSIAYHTHGTAEGGKSCCYPWLVCHDIKSAMHCSLRLAPTMIHHLTSIMVLPHSKFCHGVRHICNVDNFVPQLCQTSCDMGIQIRSNPNIHYCVQKMIFTRVNQNILCTFQSGLYMATQF